MGRVDNIDVLARDMGCKVGGLPSTYLSLPLGGVLFKPVAICNRVEERFHKRLDIWKRQYILKGGRLTLIHSTLSSMPIYFMSLFCMLMQVKLRLEKIQRDFLWGGGVLIQKPHLVRWKIICSKRKKGGLGVRCLSTMNKVHLCKWSWCFANERMTL